MTSILIADIVTYNVGNRVIKQKVGDIFNALRPADPMQKAHPMYRR